MTFVNSVVHILTLEVACICQNDDVVPPYTIPRSSIAENPFTSLLMCSSSPNLIDERTVAVSWCQDLAIEATSLPIFLSFSHA